MPPILLDISLEKPDMLNLQNCDVDITRKKKRGDTYCFNQSGKTKTIGGQRHKMKISVLIRSQSKLVPIICVC